MKKILTTILAGTLVAGAAFAADAKISVGFRTGLDAFSLRNGNGTGIEKIESNKPVPKPKNARDWMDWNGYAGGLAKDDLKISMSGDMFGATLAVTAKANSGTSPFELKQLSAWMKFNVGPGTLQLDGGNWGDFVQGSFRVNKDAGIKESLDFENSKLGSIFNVKNINFVDDLTSGNGKSSIGGFASYGLDVAEGVNLKVTVGGVQNDSFDSVEEDDNGDKTITTWKSAFASNVLLKVKGIADVKFIYKLNHTQDKNLSNTFGLYVMPQILKELTLNVGGAVGLNGADGGDDCADWGVDLRMRYQVMDPLSITFFTNVSGTTKEDGRAIKSGIVGKNGKQGYAAGTIALPKDDDSSKYKSGQYSFKVAMWNHLTGQYKINDLLTASLDVGLITPLSKIDTDKDASYSPEWRVTPAVQIFPNPESNTSLWVGVAISGASWTDSAKIDHSSFCVDIPVIFCVKW